MDQPLEQAARAFLDAFDLAFERKYLVLGHPGLLANCDTLRALLDQRAGRTRIDRDRASDNPVPFGFDEEETRG